MKMLIAFAAEMGKKTPKVRFSPEKLEMIEVPRELPKQCCV